MDLSDDQLVRKIVAGDKQSFGVLIDRYGGQVFNLMYRSSGSRDEASELTQELFCKIYEKLSTYSENKSFFSWLYTIALNQARDWERKKRNRNRKHLSYAHELQVQTEVKGEQEVVDTLHRELDSLLTQLPADRRELVILRYRYDHSIKELAEIFDLSESAVKMRIKRVLEELKQNIS